MVIFFGHLAGGRCLIKFPGWNFWLEILVINSSKAAWFQDNAGTEMPYEALYKVPGFFVTSIATYSNTA